MLHMNVGLVHGNHPKRTLVGALNEDIVCVLMINKNCSERNMDNVDVVLLFIDEQRQSSAK